MVGIELKLRLIHVSWILLYLRSTSIIVFDSSEPATFSAIHKYMPRFSGRALMMRRTLPVCCTLSASASWTCRENRFSDHACYLITFWHYLGPFDAWVGRTGGLTGDREILSLYDAVLFGQAFYNRLDAVKWAISHIYKETYRSISITLTCPAVVLDRVPDLDTVPALDSRYLRSILVRHSCSCVDRANQCRCKCRDLNHVV